MICVDASVAAKWVLDEQYSNKAVDLLRTNQDTGLMAPAFLPVEVTNAIWRRVVRRELEQSEAQELLTTFLNFGVQLASPPGIHELALRLTGQFARPTVYDMHYVALAQIAGCDLWTADQHLLNALGGRLPFVHALTDFPLSS